MPILGKYGKPFFCNIIFIFFLQLSRLLESWVTQANLSHTHHKAMAYFPYYLMANSQLLQQQAQNQNQTANQIRTNIRRIDVVDPAQVIRENGGYEYIVAPLYKRLVAEIIDIFILFMLKLLLAFVIIDLFDVNM
jgi:hypothetical protein